MPKDSVFDYQLYKNRVKETFKIISFADAIKDLRSNWEQIAKEKHEKISKALEICKDITPPQKSFYPSNKSRNSLYHLFRESDEYIFECPHCGESHDFSEYYDLEDFPTYCNQCDKRMDIYQLVKSFGDWAVTLYGIENLKRSYPIEWERLNDMDWINHMEEKLWVNLNDFAKSYTYARMFFYPGQFITPYQKYLRSPHWQEIKQKALEYYGNCCVLCSSKDNINVHHRNYKNLGKEDIRTDVIVLCRDCHKKFHSKD